MEAVRHKNRPPECHQILYVDAGDRAERVFKTFYEAEYRKTRKQWRGWITGGIVEAQKLVDGYFNEVFKLIFDGKGKPIYPSRLKF
jgi:hypothetical protein